MDLPPHLVTLIREGRLIPPRRPLRLPRPVIPYEPGSKLLSDAVINQRGAAGRREGLAVIPAEI